MFGAYFQSIIMCDVGGVYPRN